MDEPIWWDLPELNPNVEWKYIEETFDWRTAVGKLKISNTRSMV